MNNHYTLHSLEINPDIKIIQRLDESYYKNFTATAEEKIQFEKGSKEIREKIRIILIENGMDPSKVTLHYNGELIINKINYSFWQ